MELTFPLSDSIVNEFKKKMSEGQQLAKDDSLTSPDEAQVEATLLKLVGGYIKDGNVSLKDITSFLSSNVTGSEYGRMVLTDALWFWGTQTPSAPDEENGKVCDQWSRLCGLVKELGSARILDVSQMKKTLELNLLVDSGLWTDKPGLEKRLVKINTSLVYRQQKYNLLREESEGYSKLLTVLVSLPSPPMDPTSHITNIFSLIGYFDLDPNRVLDMVLEVMEHQLWNASFLTLLKKFRRSSIVHILGFKFVHYHDLGKKDEIEDSKVAKDLSDSGQQEASPLPATPTPKSLYLLAATLLTASMLELENLLPYLAPNVDDTAKLLVKDQTALKNQIKCFGVVNLSSKTSNDSESEKKTIPTTVSAISEHFGGGNQMIGMVAALILVKNWNLADKMADMFRKVANVNVVDYPDVVESLVAMISWSLESIYRSVGMLSLGLGAPSVSNVSDDVGLPLIPRLSDHVQSVDGGKMEVDNGDGFEQDLQTSGGEFAEISTLDNVVVNLKPLLLRLGDYLAVSPVLFSRICRILKLRLESLRSSNTLLNEEQDNKTAFLEDSEVQDILLLLSESLLPSLSRMECNPALAALIWGILCQLPFEVRYDMYRLWKGESFGKQAIETKPLLVCHAETRALHCAKAALKRLSKENTKQMGRQLAKHSHSSPLCVFHHILSQIAVYDNMIPFVVDALKYTTDLGKDVMSFTFLCQLNRSSEKLQPGDTHYSGWFSALAKFIGSFYRKYPSTELFGILHFLLQRLSTGDSLDLLILKELLEKMGGCETFLEVSHLQLQGLSGGRTLQLEIMKTQAQSSLSKRAVETLRNSLLSSRTALPMLLFIAQIRSNIIFGGVDSKHLKLLAYLYDICQDVLMQFTDFLVSSVNVPASGSGSDNNMNSLLELMPPLKTLLVDIGLAIPVTFQLIRPLVRLSLQYGMELQSKASEDEMKNQFVVTSEILEQIPENLRQWHPYSPDMKSLIASVLPGEVWSAISVELYITFWSLSLYDIMVPSSRYDEEIRRLNNSKASLEKSSNVGEDRSAARLRKQEMSRISNLIDSLTAEREKQRLHVDRMHKLLLVQKGEYLSHVSKEDLPNVTSHLMQYCVHDRVLLSPVDAQFCSQFFLFLHRQETPSFSTIHFIDKTVKTLAPLIFCSTEYEAGFIGFFINDLFTSCNRWVNSKNLYVKEAQSKCGFDTVFAQEQSEGRASYEQFTKIYKIWHTRLRTIIVSCLKSPEYMHVRSALRFLTKVSQEYPTRSAAGKAILSCVESLEKGKATDKEGLKIMAKGVGAMLKARSRSWIEDEAHSGGSNNKKNAGDSNKDKKAGVKPSNPLTKIAGANKGKAGDSKVEKVKGPTSEQAVPGNAASAVASKKTEKKQKIQDKKDKKNDKVDSKEPRENKEEGVNVSKEPVEQDKKDGKATKDVIEGNASDVKIDKSNARAKRGRDDEECTSNPPKKIAGEGEPPKGVKPDGDGNTTVNDTNNNNAQRKAQGGKGATRGGRGGGNREDRVGGGVTRPGGKGGGGVSDEQPYKRARNDISTGGGNYGGGGGGNYTSGGGGGRGGGGKGGPRYGDGQRGPTGGGGNDNFRGGGNYGGKGGGAGNKRQPRR